MGLFKRKEEEEYLILQLKVKKKRGKYYSEISTREDDKKTYKVMYDGMLSSYDENKAKLVGLHYVKNISDIMIKDILNNKLERQQDLRSNKMQNTFIIDLGEKKWN